MGEKVTIESAREITAIGSASRFATECYQAGINPARIASLIAGEMSNGNIPPLAGKMVIENTNRAN